MRWLLQLAGVASVLYTLFSKAAVKVTSLIDWEILPVRGKDFRLRINEKNNLVGVIDLRIEVTNRNPVSIQLKGFDAKISQGGQLIGLIQTTNIIELPAGITKRLGLELEINSQDLIKRIEAILKGGGLLEDISIQGQIYINDNAALPISQTLKFFSYG